MMNGTGLRVCLWCSGCDHHCKNCQNPITWDPNDGAKFDIKAKNEIFNELSKDYISGITLTGGDPLHQKILNPFWIWLMKFVFHIQKKQSGYIQDTHWNRLCIRLLQTILIQKEINS